MMWNFAISLILAKQSFREPPDLSTRVQLMHRAALQQGEPYLLVDRILIFDYI